MLRRRTPEHEAGRLLTAIYREHSAGAYRFAYHLTHSREDADDLVQVAFLGLHRALARGDAIVSPGAWLSTTIKRSAINLGHKRRERPASDQLDQTAGGGGHGDGAAEAAEELARVQLLLYTLPEAQHHAFVLRHWSGLANREIAEVLATTESAVESRLVRARAALLAAGSTDQACAQVCSRLAADQPLAPEHAAHLSGCRGCRTAEQRLAKAAGIAAGAALVPNLHVAHALAATVPGFSAGMATGAAGGGLAAAAGTKAGAVGALAKTGAAAVAVTAAAAIGIHTHLAPLHQAHPAPTPRSHAAHFVPSQKTATGTATGKSTPEVLQPTTAPTGSHPGEPVGSRHHHVDAAPRDGSGSSSDGSTRTPGDGGSTTSAPDGGGTQDSTPDGDTNDSRSSTRDSGGSGGGNATSPGGGDGGGSGESGGSGGGSAGFD